MNSKPATMRSSAWVGGPAAFQRVFMILLPAKA
jgi:hypothetical protein